MGATPTIEKAMPENNTVNKYACADSQDELGIWETEGGSKIVPIDRVDNFLEGCPEYCS